MKNTTLAAMPPAPNLVVAIRAGFDAVANHILLIMFPVSLDLLLWLGPQIRLSGLITMLSDQFIQMADISDRGMVELMNASRALWMSLADQFNLLAALRTYPIGVPSLLAGRLPTAAPIGTPGFWEINTVPQVILIYILISLVGLALGTLYYSLVAQAAIYGKVSWAETLRAWPGTSVKVLVLTVFWVALIVLLSIPGSFLLTLIALSGFSLGQCVLLLYGGFVLWLVLLLFFSPQGVIMFRDDFFNAIRLSVNVIRRTLPTTVIFILAIFVLSKGLDILWLTPANDSWLMIVGIFGHAFITTSVLASSFVYFRDAVRWMRGVLQRSSLSSV